MSRRDIRRRRYTLRILAIHTNQWPLVVDPYGENDGYPKLVMNNEGHIILVDNPFKPACPKPMRKQKPNRWVRTSTIFSYKEKVSQWEWHSE